MTRVNVDVFLLEKFNSESIVGAYRGNAENDVPASLDIQAAANFLGR